MSGFNIKRAPAEFVIPEDSLERFMSQQEHAACTEILSEKQSEAAVSTLYILPSAFAELNRYVGWRARTPANSSEQGGILVGCVYKDKDSQLVCGAVHHIIPSSKSGDATYIQFTHDDWILMYKEFEEKYSSSAGEMRPLRVIGWYHTHPNMPVDMSGIDRRTHINFFPDVYQFSVIINPQRGIWAVYNGNECKNCNGVLYLDKDSVPDQNVTSDFSENPCTNEHANTSSAVPFRIKRLPNPVVLQNNVRPASHDTSPADQSIQYNNQRNRQLGVNCNGGKFVTYSGRTYYLPYHSPESSYSFTVSEELVEKIRSVLDTWSFLDSEAVSFNYLVGKECQPLFKDKFEVKYYVLCDRNMNAQGFVCNRNPREYLAFHNTLYSTVQEVLMTVLFCAACPDYRTIREKYRDSDCLLWFNVTNKQDFKFFCIEKQFPSVKANPDFNIKNHPKTESGVDRKDPILGEDIYKLLFDTLLSPVREYIFPEIGEYTMRKEEHRLSIKLLKELFERIRRYGEFTEYFCIAVGYSTLVQGNCFVVVPQLNRFKNLWFLYADGRGASFKNLDDDHGAAKCAKFAFVISNYDLNIGMIRCKLIGYATAFCFNVETQDYRFYQLF